MPWRAIYENSVWLKKTKLQISDFCAIPLILDYTADKTTPTAFLTYALKDLAVIP